VEINREPIITLDMKVELIEILPGGIRILGRSMGGKAMRVGATSRGSFGVDAGGKDQIETKLLQLNKDGIVLDVAVSDSSGNVLASQELSLKNYEEGIVELATAVTADRRLAVRFLPSINVIEPVRDYPVLVRAFGMRGGGMVVLNDKEVLSNSAGGYSTVDDLNGKVQQFLILNSRSGILLISYRPFPGASLLGCFEGKKLIFECNGDVYEWISMENPFLPDGRWAAYVWLANPTPSEGGSGVMSAPIDGLQDMVGHMMRQMRKSAK
jgi:hypothetical protein